MEITLPWSLHKTTVGTSHSDLLTLCIVTSPMNGCIINNNDDDDDTTIYKVQ